MAPAHSDAWNAQPFSWRVLHEMTALDERKRTRDRRWNPHFLGIVCRDALPLIDELIGVGASEADAFAEAFTPTRETHSVAKRLGLSLDVDRGRWVTTCGIEP